MNKDKFKDLAKEVKTYYEINKDIFKSKYSILYGPYSEKPPILFIGINPGGDPDEKYDCIDELEKFEYLTAEYTLAKRTRELFKNMKLYYLFEKSVKTNMFFFRTKDEGSLYNIFDDKEDQKAFYDKSYGWISRLIEMIKPNNIICESMGVFTELIKILKSEDWIGFQYKLTYWMENNRSYLAFCESKNFNIIGISHLSGARNTNSMNKSIEIELPELLKR